MERDFCERVPVVCPECERCLKVAEVSLVDLSDRIIHGTLVCDCPREHPVIDGVPILVRDLLAYLTSERPAILGRRDLPEWAHELLGLAGEEADAGSWRVRTMATYAAPVSNDPALAPVSAPLWDFLEETLSRHARDASFGLDAGSASGGFTRVLAKHVEHAVGLEIAFDRARRAREDALRDNRRPSFIAGSMDDPPFAEGAFQVVLALNLLDVVASPRKLLDKLTTCLAPDGLLLLTTPFEYSIAHTPLEEQIDDDELVPTLAENFEIIDDRPRLPWHLPISDRHHDVYFVRAIVARKL